MFILVESFTARWERIGPGRVDLQQYPSLLINTSLPFLTQHFWRETTISMRM